MKSTFVETWLRLTASAHISWINCQRINKCLWLRTSGSISFTFEIQTFQFHASFSWKYLLHFLHVAWVQSWGMAGWDCGRVSDSWQTDEAVDNDVTDSDDNEPQWTNQRLRDTGGRPYDRIPNSSNHTTLSSTNKPDRRHYSYRDRMMTAVDSQLHEQRKLLWL